MSGLRPAISVFILSMLVLATPLVTGKELEDRKWIEVNTGHFLIRSTMSEKKTIKLVRSLDLLRLSLPLVTTITDTDSTVPTVIYAVRKSADLKLFGINSSTIGSFTPGLRRNTILLRQSPNMDETSVILHEYVHFLTRNHTGTSYPRWFDEGFAEYLSATAIIRDEFQIGLPNRDRTYGLEVVDWISPRQFLKPEEYAKLDREERSMFYAQAWLLVHFLLSRENTDAVFSDDLQEYVDLVAGGIDELAAFETAFGIPTDRIWRVTKSYLSNKCCRTFVLNVDALQPNFSPAIRKMTRAEISLGLGQTASRFREYAVAKKWYEIAIHDKASRPRAEAGLGDLLKFGGDHEAAQPHFETAVALAPDDPYVQLDFAEFWLDWAVNSQFPSEQETYIARARRSFVKAWKLDDSMPETYAMYGRSYLMEGLDFAKAVEMFEQAVLLHPSSVQIRVLLTEAYAGVGRNKDAIQQARLILSWGHNDNAPAKFARSIIAELETGEAESAAR